MTWNKWLVFTKISYDWIEQHITLTGDIARLALFVYRAYYMTFLTPPRFVRDFGVEVWFSLLVPNDPGSRLTKHFVVSVIFYRYSVLYFFFLFPTMANISIFHIDILI